MVFSEIFHKHTILLIFCFILKKSDQIVWLFILNFENICGKYVRIKMFILISLDQRKFQNDNELCIYLFDSFSWAYLLNLLSLMIFFPNYSIDDFFLHFSIDEMKYFLNSSCLLNDQYVSTVLRNLPFSSYTFSMTVRHSRKFYHRFCFRNIITTGHLHIRDVITS